MYQDAPTASPRRSIGFAATWATALSLLCVFIGEGARQFADSLDAPSARLAAHSAEKPPFNAIDYATTGAINGQTVILSPCER